MSGSSDDNLEFNCPQCKTQIKVPPSQAGQRSQCPRCAAPIFVPGMELPQEDLFGDLFDDDVEQVDEPKSQKMQPANSTEPEPIELTPESGTDDRRNDSLQDELKVDDENLSFDDDVVEQVAESAEKADPLAFLDDVGSAIEKTAEKPHESAVDLLDDILTPDEPHPLEDDLLAGSAMPSTPTVSLDAPDPFESRDDEPLKIDGVDGSYGSEMISIVCPVCDSRVYGRRRAQGYQIKCDDCYSMVEIPSSAEWDAENKVDVDPRKQANAMQISVDEPDDGDLKLQEPVEKPSINYDVDDEFGLEPVDTDLLAPKVHPIESELFHRSDAEPTPNDPAPNDHPQIPSPESTPVAETATPIADPGDELMLQPLDENDLGPILDTTSPPSEKSAPAETFDDDQIDLLPLDDLDGPSRIESPSTLGYPHTEPAATQPEPDKQQPAAPSPSPESAEAPQTAATTGGKPLPDNIEGDKSDDRPVGEMLKDWLKAPLLLFKSPEALAQIGFYFLLQALSLMLVGLALYYMKGDESNTSDTRTLSQTLAYFPYFFGKVIGLCAWLYQGVILYNCILLGLYQDSEAAEWPEANIEEIFSQIWRVGLANIAAGVPLLLLLIVLSPLGIAGAIIAVILGTIILFLLGPPLMMSALYNQTFYKIVSPKIFQSYKTVTKSWIIFYGFMMALWFIYMATSLMTIANFCLINGIAALIWAVVITVQGGLIGYQFRQIMLATGDVAKITPTDKELLPR